MALEGEINNKLALANNSLGFWKSKAASAQSSLDMARDSYNYYSKLANSGVSGTVSQEDISQAKTAADTALSNMDFFKQQYNDASDKVTSISTEIADLTVELNNAQNPSNPEPVPSSVNQSVTDEETIQKYQNAEIVGDASVTENYSNEGRNYGSIGVISPGAMPSSPVPATVSVTSMTGSDRISTDMRVKIRVPTSYLTALTSGLAGAGANDGFPVTPLKALGGVVFPYTPTISVEHKADYATQQPMHSNFALNFYQKSSVSPITITGSFTVQNEKEAATFIATVHLLRALTKMRSGGNKSGDLDSGAPPPVCRLDAYGSFMLDNIPVAISSFKVDFPDNVDYFTLGKQSGTAKSLYDMTAVPVKSSITVTCIPMYSRNEMRSFSVTSWLNNRAIRKGGYL